MRDLNIEDSPNYTFISDKQTGLQKTLDELVPSAEHRHCARHLFNNFKKSYKSQALKDKFMTTAKSTTIARFTVEIEKI